MNNEVTQQKDQRERDGFADAIAAGVIVTVIILAAIMWITGH